VKIISPVAKMEKNMFFLGGEKEISDQQKFENFNKNCHIQH
jgi:hypothetical protein